MDRSPRRSPLFFRMARPYVRRQLARALDGLYAAGVEQTRELLATRPVILAANHVAWWDPLLLVALDEALGAEGYALMDRENLGRFPIFTRLGGVPLDRERPRAGLRLAAGLLDRPRRAVWIFPQGHERPPHLRPLGFRRGVSVLARLAPPEAVMVPVGIHYAFREGHYPAALVSLGAGIAPREVAQADGVGRLEEAVEHELDRIDRDLEGAGSGFVPIVPSRLRRPDSGAGARMLDRLLRR